MQWRRSNPQALRAARDRRIVYRLDIDPIIIQQKIAQTLAQERIAHYHRHDVAGVVKMRNTDLVQSPANGANPLLVALAFERTRLQVTDASKGASSHRGRQRRRENEARCEAANEV